MVRLISRQRRGLAALKLTKLFGIDDFPAAKDSGKVLIIIIYCYLIIIIIKVSFFYLSPLLQVGFTAIFEPFSYILLNGSKRNAILSCNHKQRLGRLCHNGQRIEE